MHLGLLTNTRYLDENLTGFNHLVVGLIDDGVRVVQVVPERVGEGELSIFGERMSYRISSLRPITRHRVLSLGPYLVEREVSVLMAMSGEVWRDAAELARRHDLALVLQANSAADVRGLAGMTRLLRPTQTAVIAATGPILEAMQKQLHNTVLCEAVAPGVHIPTLPEPTSTETGTESEPTPQALTPSVVITTDGKLSPSSESLIRALPAVIEAIPEIQFFLDGQDANQHELWKLASKLGLLGNLSLIPRKLGHRELILRADLIVQPQAMNLARSLTLDAMAHRIALIAQDDPWVDYLLENVTCRLVDQPTVQEWERMLLQILRDPAAMRRLGKSAQDYVRKHHAMSQQVAQTLDICRRLSGESLAFTG